MAAWRVTVRIGILYSGIMAAAASAGPSLFDIPLSDVLAGLVVLTVALTFQYGRWYTRQYSHKRVSKMIGHVTKKIEESHRI